MIQLIITQDQTSFSRIRLNGAIADKTHCMTRRQRYWWRWLRPKTWADESHSRWYLPLTEPEASFCRIALCPSCIVEVVIIMLQGPLVVSSEFLGVPWFHIAAHYTHSQPEMGIMSWWLGGDQQRGSLNMASGQEIAFHLCCCAVPLSNTSKPVVRDCLCTIISSSIVLWHSFIQERWRVILASPSHDTFKWQTIAHSRSMDSGQNDAIGVCKRLTYGRGISRRTAIYTHLYSRSCFWTLQCTTLLHRPVPRQFKQTGIPCRWNAALWYHSTAAWEIYGCSPLCVWHLRSMSHKCAQCPYPQPYHICYSTGTCSTGAQQPQ